jgi:hypothetical protein
MKTARTGHPLSDPRVQAGTSTTLKGLVPVYRFPAPVRNRGRTGTYRSPI